MYSSLGRRTGYREHLFRDFGCMLDKGLELSQCAMSGGGKAVGALGGNVLLETEAVDGSTLAVQG